MGRSDAVIERAKKAAGQKRATRKKTSAKKAKKSSSKKSTSKAKKPAAKKKKEETISHADRAHALLSASGSKQWINCPGSINAGRDIPEPPEGPWAAEGTHAHEYSEQLLVQIFKDYPGVSEYTGHKEIEAKDREMSNFIAAYVTYILNQTLENEKVEVVDVFIEKKLTLCPERDMYGTADFIAIIKAPDGNLYGLIIDLKYGSGVFVIAKDNPQLEYYACALIETFPQYDLKGVKVHIFQPRIKCKEGPGRWDYFPAEDLKLIREEILHNADIALNADPKDPSNFEAGEHCRFCKCKDSCITYAAHHVKSVEADFAEFDELEKGQTPELSHDTVLRILGNKDKIKKAIEIVEKYCFEMAMQGHLIPGTKCVHKQKRKRWRTDVEVDEIAKSLRNRGVKNPYKEPQLIPFKDVDDEIGKKMCEDLKEQPEPEIAIALSSDKRPEVDATTGRLKD